MTKTASIKYNVESNDKERLLKPLAVKATFSRQITKRNSRIGVCLTRFFDTKLRERSESLNFKN